MAKKLLLAGLLSLMGMATANAAAMTYTLDPNPTQVSFCWVHFGFSKPCANFNKVQGTLVFDPVDPVRSSVSTAGAVFGRPRVKLGLSIGAVNDTFSSGYRTGPDPYRLAQ